MTITEFSTLLCLSLTAWIGCLAGLYAGYHRILAYFVSPGGLKAEHITRFTEWGLVSIVLLVAAVAGTAAFFRIEAAFKEGEGK